MIIFILTIMVILNFFLQSAILPYVSVLGVVPNTALLIIISVSLLKGKYYGGFLGLAMGLLQDILFSSVIGINGFIYFFAGYFLGIIENRLSRYNILIPFILSIIGTIYYNFTYYIFMFFLAQNIPFLSFAKHMMIVEIIYNMILSIPIYLLLTKLFIEPTIKFHRE